jgi:hypothetical protein
VLSGQESISTAPQTAAFADRSRSLPAKKSERFALACAVLDAVMGGMAKDRHGSASIGMATLSFADRALSGIASAQRINPATSRGAAARRA